MRTTAVGSTWAKTHTFRARRLYSPSSIDEAAAVVAQADRVVRWEPATPSMTSPTVTR